MDFENILFLHPLVEKLLLPWILLTKKSLRALGIGKISLPKVSVMSTFKLQRRAQLPVSLHKWFDLLSAAVFPTFSRAYLQLFTAGLNIIFFFFRLQVVNLILPVLQSFLLYGWSTNMLKIIYIKTSKMINEIKVMKGLMQELSGLWLFCCPSLLGLHFTQSITHLLSRKQFIDSGKQLFLYPF